MDISKEYVKMCEKAVEIQNLWKPQDFDFVMGQYISVIKVWEIVQDVGHASLKPLFTTAGKWAWYSREELIWLPRQDQLQYMVLDIGGNPFKLYNNFPSLLVREFNEAINPNMNQTLGRNTEDNHLEHFDKVAKFEKERSLRQNYYEDFDTMEQLWLAFVMERKYGKKWNGREWVQ